MTKRREPRQRRKPQTWTVDDARWFLESTWHAGEALYAAFVLVLVLGLRRGEVLGLAWDQIDLDNAELYVGQQLQRVGRQLIRREVKTETSEAPLPLPDLCITALKIRRKQQDKDRAQAGARLDRQRAGLHHSARHPDRAAQLRPELRPVHHRRPRPKDHRARHPQDVRLTAGRPGRTSPRGYADSSAQQDRGHDGDLHRGTFGRHSRRAPQARPTGSPDGCCRLLLPEDQKRPVPESEPASELGGRYWDRTSDLLGVNEALSR